MISNDFPNNLPFTKWISLRILAFQLASWSSVLTHHQSLSVSLSVFLNPSTIVVAFRTDCYSQSSQSTIFEAKKIASCLNLGSVPKFRRDSEVPTLNALLENKQVLNENCQALLSRENLFRRKRIPSSLIQRLF